MLRTLIAAAAGLAIIFAGSTISTGANAGGSQSAVKRPGASIASAQTWKNARRGHAKITYSPFLPAYR
jgi:hypothetical protein